MVPSAARSDEPAVHNLPERSRVARRFEKTKRDERRPLSDARAGAQIRTIVKRSAVNGVVLAREAGVLEKVISTGRRTHRGPGGPARERHRCARNTNVEAEPLSDFDRQVPERFEPGADLRLAQAGRARRRGVHRERERWCPAGDPDGRAVPTSAAEDKTWAPGQTEAAASDKKHEERRTVTK